jgi:hypothetical protein
VTRKWNIPLTYEPKIEPVKRGDCTQTIRPGRKFSVGDLVRFYVWRGRPYWSKRTTVTEYMPIIIDAEIRIFPDGIVLEYNPEHDGQILSWKRLDFLAALDGIVHPTGEALRDVLIQKNGKIPADGIEAQVIRWNPAGKVGVPA